DAARAVAPRAPLTAGRWLRTALRLLPRDVDAGQRIGLLCEAAAALASAGADEESVAELEQALALTPSAQPAARAELNARLAAAQRPPVRVTRAAAPGAPVTRRTQRGCRAGAAA